MDLTALLKKRDFYQANKAKIPEEVRKKLDASFAINYAHNSTAIEGNTLSLLETKLLLEDVQLIQYLSGIASARTKGGSDEQFQGKSNRNQS